MGLMIRLEEEEGYEIGFIEETELLRSLIPSLDEEGYELLGYVDPYGDTIFNWSQAQLLISDLERAKGSKANSTEAVELLERIIQLARQCAGQPYLYLKFLDANP
jgi:hypothetical protein